MKHKICTQCNKKLKLDNYNYIPSTGRLRAKCKQCVKINKHTYYMKNKDKINEKKRQWRQKNIEYCNAQDKKRYNKNKEKLNEQMRQYYIQNKDKIKEQRRKYKEYNKDKVSKLNRDRLKRNPHLRISISLRRRVRTEIGSGKDYLILLGCSKRLLNKWFEYNFELDQHLNLSWENYGNIWSIDHVIPCKFFNMDSKKEQKICFNWKNTLPVLKSYNIKKNAKIKIIDIIKLEIRIKLFYKKYRTKRKTNYYSFVEPILPRLHSHS